MEISLEKAYDILRESSGVIIDDSVAVVPTFHDLKGEDWNDFMTIRYVDEDGQKYLYIFPEEGNNYVEVSGSSMFLSNSEGEEMQISILKPNDMERIKAKWVQNLEVIDPDTNAPVGISVYKEESGGMFAVDSSYLENDVDIVMSPHNNGEVELED